MALFGYQIYYGPYRKWEIGSDAGKPSRVLQEGTTWVLDIIIPYLNLNPQAQINTNCIGQKLKTETPSKVA